MPNSQTIGLPKHELETPALCVDETIYRRNAARMMEFLQPRGIGWRPHMKGQKCPQLALIAQEAGAIGVTCATVYEAEVMAEAGIGNILIAHETTGAQKLRRLARLERTARVISATDSAEHLAMVAEAAQAEGVTVPVLIELNIGMDRAGIAPGEPALELARQAVKTPGLAFAGIMGWEGHVLTIGDIEERTRATHRCIQLLLDTVALVRSHGIPVEIVSSSGSGTFLQAGQLEGITEVQAGGGTLFDQMYRRWGVPNEFSLTVVTRVVSRPSPTRVITDAGWKAVCPDHGLPLTLSLPEHKSFSLSAEHGNLELAQPSDTPRVGDVIELVPAYTDSTVCLHDEMCVVRDGVVTAVWPIAGRSGRR
ncbi:MAG: alanine racemase [Bryobacterales bacterium]|nr:alanine racemase [Bryobacterales bacterium]